MPAAGHGRGVPQGERRPQVLPPLPGPDGDARWAVDGQSLAVTVTPAGTLYLRDEGNRYALAMRDAGVLVDLREERSLTHAFANFFPLGGGSATATTAMISALRAHLSHA